MSFADRYFSSHKGFSPYFKDIPSQKPEFIMVIPAYCELQLLNTLESLWECERPKGNTEIIIFINSSPKDGKDVHETNRRIRRFVEIWIENHPDPVFRFLMMYREDLPARDAGAGLARKIAMDEALFRLTSSAQTGGYILSLDADCLCDRNYFTAIEKTIAGHKTVHGFSVYFEHPLAGNEYPEEVYQGIADYELHMRYNKQFQYYSGFPYAFHTVGSCFGVKAEIYATQGGMNKRKGGEDFYFLHKVIPLGHYFEINSTRVIPSPRPSARAPFGTGNAISRYLSSGLKSILTYSPDHYFSLKVLFERLPALYKAGTKEIEAVLDQLPDSLRSFLYMNNAKAAIDMINSNCSSLHSFKKRFFRWFDAFRIVKFLNYASREFVGQVPVNIAAIEFLGIKGYNKTSLTRESKELLEIFRKLDRENN